MLSRARRPSQVQPEPRVRGGESSSSTAEAVVVAALALLPSGSSRQKAAPLVALLGERGIVCGWQLARLTMAELSELATDRAGWTMGEMLALREAVARESLHASGTRGSLPAMLEGLLQVPASDSKADLRTFASARLGLAGMFGAVHCMPPDEAKASMLQVAEVFGNMAAILAFVLWQMRVAHDAGTASYSDIAPAHNFIISLGVVFCLMTYLMSIMFFCFTSSVPAERFQRDSEFVMESARYLQNVVILGFPGQFLAMAAVLTEAWHGQKQWYAVALTAVLFLLWGLQSPKDIRFCSRPHALLALHAPQWFRSMIGISINADMVEAAKRSSDLLRSIYEERNLDD